MLLTAMKELPIPAVEYEIKRHTDVQQETEVHFIVTTAALMTINTLTESC
jgi:hypothetical protein